MNAAGRRADGSSASALEASGDGTGPVPFRPGSASIRTQPLTITGRPTQGERRGAPPRPDDVKRKDSHLHRFLDRAVGWAGRLALLAALSPIAGCAVLNHGMLAAGGPVMAQERHLFLIVSFVMLFVVGPVLLLTPIVAWHYRLSNTKSAYRPEWAFSWPLEFFIWVPPTIIVMILGVFLWNFSHTLDPYRPLPSDKPALRVQAVALDWKWLFVYPDEGIATINQLVIPTDRPVHLAVTSGTVMQSLLLPRLAGQIYAMAGMTTELNFAADAPGDFRGENAQYSGDGFPQEKFPVKAMAPDAYAAWLATAHADGSKLDFDGYKHLVAVREPSGPKVFGSVAPHLFEDAVNQNMPGARSADMNKKDMK